MVTRRGFVKTGVAGAASAGFPMSAISASEGGARPPNVLFIIADDMNDYGFHESLPSGRSREAGD